MKKTNPVFLSVLLLAQMASTAFAQDHTGNGGGGEIEFANIASELKNWVIDANKSDQLSDRLGLKSLNLNATTFTSTLSQLVDTTPVLFTNDQVFIERDGVKIERVCRNNTAPAAGIVCNRDEWKKTPGNVRYGIVMHEYLGIAGIEENKGIYSQYPISRNVLSYVYATQKYALGTQKLLGAGVYNGVIVNRKTGAMLTAQCADDSCNQLVFHEITTDKDGSSQMKQISKFSRESVSYLADRTYNKMKAPLFPAIEIEDNSDVKGWFFEFTGGLWNLIDDAQGDAAYIPAIIGGAIATPITGVVDVAATVAVDGAALISYPIRSVLAGSKKKARRISLNLIDPNGRTMKASDRSYNALRDAVAGSNTN